MRKVRDTRLPAPFLRRVAVLEDRIPSPRTYPFDLPWLSPDWELSFSQPVTLLVGENGTGKSTLLEALAALAGYDEAGGGKGYRPVDHSKALDQSGAQLSDALRGSWLPKVTRGWFFRAESFFAVARYLDEVGSPTADFLSWSHGEGFVRFFEERLGAQGIYFLDEPESALSPRRQFDLLKVLHRIQETRSAQVIMATHSPILMALPGAEVMLVRPRGLEVVGFRETPHFRMWRDFMADPEAVVAARLAEDEPD